MASKPGHTELRESTLTPCFTTRMGILFQVDCLQLLPAIRSDSIDCVFADPPFNLNKEYRNGFKDSQEDAAYLDWCRKWIRECCRVVMSGGVIFIYALPRWAYHLGVFLESGGMEFRHWISLTMKGTYPRGRRLYPAHYALLYFTKGPPRVFNKLRLPVPKCRHCGGDIRDYGGHRKALNPAGLNLTDFWDDTSPNRHKGSKTRPGVNELKPLIPARAIGIATRPGDVVLDPFGGGGSTYQEAERGGRYWIGCELGSCAAIEARMCSVSSLSPGQDPPDMLLGKFSTAIAAPIRRLPRRAGA